MYFLNIHLKGFQLFEIEAYTVPFVIARFGYALNSRGYDARIQPERRITVEYTIAMRSFVPA